MSEEKDNDRNVLAHITVKGARKLKHLALLFYHIFPCLSREGREYDQILSQHLSIPHRMK